MRVGHPKNGPLFTVIKFAMASTADVMPSNYANGEKRMANIKAEDFVRIWCTSDNLDEVQARTGKSRKALSVRASQYRRKGVNLPKFIRGSRKPTTDWNKLAAMVDEIQEAQ